MGVHDYICFIHRNGQDLCYYELMSKERENEPKEAYDASARLKEQRKAVKIDIKQKFKAYESLCGSDQAVIVLIPRSVSLDTIKTMNLKDFAQFEHRKVRYNPSKWSFKGFDNYYENLVSYDSTLPPGVWRSSDCPGYYLVNFEPNAYEVFVTEKERSRVGYDELQEILEAEGIDMYSKFPDLDMRKIIDYIQSRGSH